MRVLIAESQSRVRFALRVTVERHEELSGVSEVSDARELLSQTGAMHPDLLLLDWELTGAAPDTVGRLRELCPRLYIIALSEKDQAREAALKAGVDVFVSKAEPPERLLAALKEYGKPQPDPRELAASPEPASPQ
ncbi:MAG: response regulator transcription factor [Rudaea sp.]